MIKTNDVGVVYVAWGNKGIEEATYSALSCKSFDLKVCLITDESSRDMIKTIVFDVIKVIDFPEEMTSFSRKMIAYQESPFLKTLYLDADCVLLFDPMRWFDALDKHSLAVAHAPYPYFQWKNEHIIQFNTGVQFFVKCHQMKSFVYQWKIAAHYFKSEFERDQYGYSLALHNSDLNVLVLPYTCNYRAGLDGVPQCLQGPLYVWHSRDPVPKKLKEYNSQFHQERLNFKWAFVRDLAD